ncbi:terminase gpP N-terminus-related DNA-binding protein [Elizabethkingia miricola]|uniref:terminase gpP N-terminus-related DNA-binding protein n=1 Tax=Elizabethkingia miricola TaxID=172045 RepID=UPI000C15FCAB|nr:hypothetical protein [Elizabethkingia miricola]NHQ65264.1 hypothetical protein [Elizabethkingia miricola]NHQ72613.1 hypothetical protein [Elizabethkingia miricola]NHQ79682.1 hypothetical protein [Elizabethkingia miricola]PSL86712.1 hypothetical protein C7V10_19245 [Elizabethkingia miricola]QHQ86200.1 hypothetical protein FE632_05165 [Elizabethkingia miricola]
MNTKTLITPEIKQKAFKYFCMGLNSHEISKLLDCSYRTIQNYMSAENWKERRDKLKTQKPKQ